MNRPEFDPPESERFENGYRSVNFEVVLMIPDGDRPPTEKEIHKALWKHLNLDGPDAIKVAWL